jgi:hypothetical protein
MPQSFRRLHWVSRARFQRDSGAVLKTSRDCPEQEHQHGVRAEAGNDTPDKVEVGSNRPATNFPRISMDTTRVHYLVEKSGLNVDPRRLAIPTEQGESRHVGV